MSNTLRNGADGEDDGTGTALMSTTVYVVEWRWIILHCVTELGGIVLLVMTNLATARKKVKVPV